MCGSPYRSGQYTERDAKAKPEGPVNAELTLTGSERGFDLLDASSLSASFDLSQVQLETPYSFDVEKSIQPFAWTIFSPRRS
jgi:hypothetical protein